jgi:dihydropteroate synthase
MTRQMNNSKTLHWGERTYIMGILNLTPDSFSGDGLMSAARPLESALTQAGEFASQGADILDLGAESSRPGSQPVSAEEELERLLPVLEAVRHALPEMILSVDTCKAAVAGACLDAGADWINDIWGLRADTRLGAVIAARGATAVLMHNRSHSAAVRDLGSLGKSYSEAHYGDFIQDVKYELADSLALARAAGIPKKKVILDPGIGFGKSVAQNLALINRLNAFRGLGCPLLIGPSRKSFIGQVLDLPVDQREEGTAAALAVGIAHGADIVRVHNVGMMARAVRVADAIVRGQA